MALLIHTCLCTYVYTYVYIRYMHAFTSEERQASREKACSAHKSNQVICNIRENTQEVYNSPHRHGLQSAICREARWAEERTLLLCAKSEESTLQMESTIARNIANSHDPGREKRATDCNKDLKKPKTSGPTTDKAQGLMPTARATPQWPQSPTTPSLKASIS